MELDEAERLWIAAGGRIMLVTLTIGHRRWQGYGVVRGRLGRSWRRVNTARARLGWTSRIPGYFGQVRAVDDTWGKNGWHPHYHLVMFVGADAEPADVEASLVAEWIGACARVLRDDGVLENEAAVAAYVRDARRACNVQLVEADETDLAAVACYPFKAAMEIFRTDLKQAGEGKSPWQLLGAAIRGNRRAGELWGQYATATRGLHAGQWSRDLRQWYMTAQRKREHRLLNQAAARDGFTPGAFFSGVTWQHIRRRGWEQDAFDAIANGHDAVVAFAVARSLPVLTVVDVARLVGPDLPRLPTEALTRGQLDQVREWMRHPLHGPPAPGQRRSAAAFHGRRIRWIDPRQVAREQARRQRVRARRLQPVVDRLVRAGLVDGAAKRPPRRTIVRWPQAELPELLLDPPVAAVERRSADPE